MFFDGIKVVEDQFCNDNGNRLKRFCRSKKLYIAATFFKHRRLHRYTWYSNDGRTRKVIDNVLAERYEQQYITDCRVLRGFNVDSDHRYLRTTLFTPMTRHARARYCKNPTKPKLDIKALKNPNVRQKYCSSVDTYLSDSSITGSAEKILQALQLAAEDTLPPKLKSEKESETWKNDVILNDLMLNRSNMMCGSSTYKDTTKKIKKRVRLLRTEKLKKDTPKCLYAARYLSR